MYTKSVVLAIVICFAYGQDREIKSQLHPGCNDCPKNTPLVYVRAQGPADTMHQIWDFTNGAPSIIFAIGETDSTMNITWQHDKPLAFNWSQKPKYSFAMVIDKLYEYNDTDDSGHIEDRYMKHYISLDKLRWYLHTTKLGGDEVKLMVQTDLHDSHNRYPSGKINITLDLIPFRDYAIDLPHLIHTANSTSLDVSLADLPLTPSFNASRYAVHLLMISTDSALDTMHYAMRKSLDDEHTPGVFEIIEVKTPESYSGGDGGFVQFRPVGYSQPRRRVDTSVGARLSDFTRLSVPEDSTVGRFYRSQAASDLLAQGMFVSFGDAGDGFYRATNYTSWTCTIGYGTPPLERFSLFVILIISIGVGVPVALALSGVVFVCVRRSRHNRPARLTEDD